MKLLNDNKIYLMESTISIICLENKNIFKKDLVEEIIKSSIFKSIHYDWKNILLKEKFVNIEIQINGYDGTLEIGLDAFINWNIDWKCFRNELFFRIEIIEALRVFFDIIQIKNNVLFMSDTDSEIGTLYMLVSEDKSFDDVLEMLKKFKVHNMIDEDACQNNGTYYNLDIWEVIYQNN